MNDADKGADDALAFLAPVERSLTVDGVSLVITPLVMKEVPQVIRAIDPLLVTLLVEGETLDAPRMVSLLGTHGDAIIQAVAICVRRDVEWVGNLLPDRVVALALASVEVNADFFSRALMAAKAQAPKIAPTLAAKIMAGQWPGQMPSTV